MAGPYVHPVPGAKVKRLDQGIDFQGKPGQPVLAIGNAHIDYVKDDPGGFGKAIYYTLLDGPNKGQQFYVGHAKPVVTSGNVAAGQPIALLQKKSGGNASGLSGWTEIGYAKNGVPEPVSAQRFKRFLETQTGAGVGTPSADAAATADASSPGSPMAAAPAPVSYRPPLLGPGLATPGLLSPGSVPAEGMSPRQIADSWQQIAAQSGASPDTLSWLQTAQTAAAGG